MTKFHHIEEAVTFTQIANKMKMDRRTVMKMLTSEQWKHCELNYNYQRGKSRKIPSGMVAYLFDEVFKITKKS